MPTLKQLTCRIESVPSNIPLNEYKTRYGDGYVETFIRVPSTTTTPFSVHLTSEGYIAPGLAMFVYMDGIPQCNRNRTRLGTPHPQAAPSDYQVDFRVRQKEEKLDGEKFIGREWTFAQLNTVAADAMLETPKTVLRNIGTIEVVVLRCQAGEVQSLSNDLAQYQSRQPQPSSFPFGLDGANDDDRAKDKHNRKHKGRASSGIESIPVPAIMQPPAARSHSGSGGKSSSTTISFHQSQKQGGAWSEASNQWDNQDMNNHIPGNARAIGWSGQAPASYQQMAQRGYPAPSYDNSSSASSFSIGGSTMGPSREPKPFVKPYWQNAPGDDADGRRGLYIVPEEPLFAVPERLVNEEHKSHQVRAMRGRIYHHATGVPAYIDSFEHPYSVFVFKYRSREALERLVPGIKIKKDMVPLTQRLESMTREQLMAYTLRMKRRAGSAASSDDDESRTEQRGGSVSKRIEHQNWQQNPPQQEQQQQPQQNNQQQAPQQNQQRSQKAPSVKNRSSRHGGSNSGNNNSAFSNHNTTDQGAAATNKQTDEEWAKGNGSNNNDAGTGQGNTWDDTKTAGQTGGSWDDTKNNNTQQPAKDSDGYKW